MLRAIAIGLLLGFSGAAASAAAPAMLPVQGYLSDAAGPIEGPVELAVALYGTATGGAHLYRETQTVEVVQGYFTVYVGSTTPVDLALFRDHGQLFLGLTVGTEPEMQPRFRIASAPFAGYAEYAGSAEVADNAVDAAALGGLPPTSYVQVGADIAWTDVLAPAGMDQLAELVCVDRDVIRWNGTLSSWECVQPEAVVETDPYFNAAPAGGITAGQITNWGTAYGWGNHATEGYLKAVPADGVGSAQITDGTVSSADLANGTILFADWAMNACTANQVAKVNGAGNAWICADDNNSLGTVTSVGTGSGLQGGPITVSGSISIAPSGVNSSHIADGTITAGDLADGAVTSAKILDGTIGVLDLADGAVSSLKIADGTIAVGDLADDAVTSAKILNSTIVAADVGFNYASSDSKGGPANDLACSGCVASSDIADSTITLADWSVGSCLSNQVAKVNGAGNGWVCANDSAGGPAGGDLTGSYPDPTVARLQGRGVSSVMPALGQVLKYDGSNWSPGSAVTSVDTNSGLTGGPITGTGTIGIASSGVTSAHIGDGAVGNADLADNAVNSVKIADGTVGNGDLADNAVNSAKITDGAIGSVDVGFNYASSDSKAGPANDLACSGCVGSTDIADGAITFADWAPNGCTPNQIPKRDALGTAWICSNQNTNADTLDSRDGSFYQDATNINAGTLGAAYFSARADLVAEGHLDNDADTDLVTRVQGDARWGGRAAVGMDFIGWTNLTNTWPPQTVFSKAFVAPANGSVLINVTGTIDYPSGCSNAECYISTLMNNLDADAMNHGSYWSNGCIANWSRESIALTRMLDVTGSTSYTVYLNCYGSTNTGLDKPHLSVVFAPQTL